MNDLSDTTVWLRWWPGLPKIWQSGDRTALVIAVAFAVALNVSIASYGIWPHMLPEPVRWIWTLAVAAFWGLSLASRNIDDAKRVAPAEKEWDRGLFIEAQGEYLKGHWFEAEEMLLRLIRTDPTDDAARMMLASVYRRAGQAEKGLQQLEAIQHRQVWDLEIRQEQAQLCRLVSSHEPPAVPTEDSQPQDSQPQENQREENEPQDEPQDGQPTDSPQEPPRRAA